MSWTKDESLWKPSKRVLLFALFFCLGCCKGPRSVEQVGSADLLISAFSCELPGASDWQVPFRGPCRGQRAEGESRGQSPAGYPPGHEEIWPRLQAEAPAQMPDILSLRHLSLCFPEVDDVQEVPICRQGTADSLHMWNLLPCLGGGIGLMPRCLVRSSGCLVGKCLPMFDLFRRRRSPW